MIFCFGCRLKIYGRFPQNDTFVIMANHVSFLDVFAIPTVFQGKFSAIAADKNFKIPIWCKDSYNNNCHSFANFMVFYVNNLNIYFY